MSMLDYGAILKKDGIFINKNQDLFINMKEVTGFLLEEATFENGETIRINNNFFVYAGDKEMLLCFYKGICLVVSNGKVIKELSTPFLSETFFLDNLPNVTISRLDKTLYIDEYGTKYYSYRFIATWIYKGHEYECIYGYGIDADEDIWEDIKYNDYGFSKSEIEIIDKWFQIE